MGKKPLFLIAPITFFVVLAGGLYLSYVTFFSKPNAIVIHESLKVLSRGSLKLARLWSEGIIDGPEQAVARFCAKTMGFPNKVDDEYFRCNPNFIDCFIAKRGLIQVRHNGEDRKIFVRKSPKSSESSKFYSIVTRANRDGVEIPKYAMKVSLYLKDLKNYSLPVLLSDVCHNTYLPRRIYSYGLSEWRWDNFNRDIFIDKHLASFRDILEWLEFDPTISKEHKTKIKALIPVNKNEWSMPAYGLTEGQMKRYCAFRGKQLIDAHIFDAATFMPADKKNPRPFTVAKPPYSWTLKRKKSFLYLAQHYPDFVFDESYCQKAFTKECLSFGPYIAFGTYSISWIGIFSVLGGYMELMRNPIHPQKNLKLSSFYFDAKSEWHRLGKRAFWDGERIKNIEELKDLEQTIKIGFRCMGFEI